MEFFGVGFLLFIFEGLCVYVFVCMFYKSIKSGIDLVSSLCIFCQKFHQNFHFFVRHGVCSSELKFN